MFSGVKVRPTLKMSNLRPEIRPERKKIRKIGKIRKIRKIRINPVMSNIKGKIVALLQLKLILLR